MGQSILCFRRVLRCRKDFSDTGAKTEGRRFDEGLHVRDLRIRLRRRRRPPGDRHRTGHQMGRCAGQLDLSGLRGRQGRFRDDRDLNPGVTGPPFGGPVCVRARSAGFTGVAARSRALPASAAHCPRPPGAARPRPRNNPARVPVRGIPRFSGSRLRCGPQ